MSEAIVSPKMARPGAARGGFVISLDFELMWGVLASGDPDDHVPNILGARTAIPKLLDLFEDFELACTWAIVGLLFFDRRDEMIAALPGLCPEYSDASLSSYRRLAEVGAEEETDPLHFGLSLIRQIRARPRQEIGTHTFSHYFCVDAGDDAAPFAADLEAVHRAAGKEGIQPCSIVFPRNQVTDSALQVCVRQGISAFRGNQAGWFHAANASNANRRIKRLFRLMDTYLPLSGSGAVEANVSHGMVNVAASCFLRPWSGRLSALDPLRLARIKRGMRSAAAEGKIYHLWFHPHNFGVNQDENFAFLRSIAEEARRLDQEFGWPGRTMGEIAAEVTAAGPVIH